ncbi:MAG: hypothetical protein VKI42_07350, partial [Synechococcaceae cyanobacterium]|nr:hypothetical protein [Synechococcaceae cyanobacterium]
EQNPDQQEQIERLTRQKLTEGSEVTANSMKPLAAAGARLASTKAKASEASAKAADADAVDPDADAPAAAQALEELATAS